MRGGRKWQALARPAVILIATVLASTGCGSTAGAPASATPLAAEAIVTAHTTRLPASDPETQAIALTQTVYAATREDNAPGAIILCPQVAAEAFTAMNRITHMPVNAPLLYLGSDGRPSAATMAEMKRLRPRGVVQDGKVQVYLVGTADPRVAYEIERKLHYKVRTLLAPNPVALAELLDRWEAALKTDHADEVVISALDHPQGIAYGIGAMSFNAHMGKAFAWVYRDSIPDATRRILARRFGGAYMYLTGNDDVISDRVAAELSRYGYVQRIQGPDVYAANAVNAGYKDFGRNFGYWIGWKSRDFGWGISEAGHNFVIGSTADILSVIPAVLLGHMGKHGPTLLVAPDSVPQSVRTFLEHARPYATGPRETVLNFAWIIGDEAHVSWRVQREIDQLLRPRPTSLAGIESAAGDSVGGEVRHADSLGAGRER